MASVVLACPKCGSTRIDKFGFRYLDSGLVKQRYICKDCSFHFSNKSYKLNRTIRDRQICVIKAKNLTNPTKTKIVAVDNKNTQKGQIVQFCFHLEQQAYAEATVKMHYSVLKVLMDRGGDLTDSESIKTVIAKQSWSQNRRRNVIASYTRFLGFYGLTWDPPICRVTRKFPFIPIEQEIDDLVAGCSKTVATFLQLMKETAMRSGEAHRIKWTDIDFKRLLITLNEPEKGSLPRIFSSPTGKLMNMLSAMPKTSEYVFGNSTANSKKATFHRAKNRLAHKLQNPRLKQIHFHTLRHWKATMLYHQTKDLLYVAEFLGHKNIENTRLYIQLEKNLFKNTTDTQFHSRVACDVKEACELITAGYEYVTGEYGDGGKIFRKRK